MRGQDRAKEIDSILKKADQYNQAENFHKAAEAYGKAAQKMDSTYESYIAFLKEGEKYHARSFITAKKGYCQLRATIQDVIKGETNNVKEQLAKAHENFKLFNAPEHNGQYKELFLFCQRYTKACASLLPVASLYKLSKYEEAREAINKYMNKDLDAEEKVMGLQISCGLLKQGYNKTKNYEDLGLLFGISSGLKDENEPQSPFNKYYEYAKKQVVATCGENGLKQLSSD